MGNIKEGMVTSKSEVKKKRMRKMVVSEGTIKTWIESPGRLREKNNAGKENQYEQSEQRYRGSNNSTH